MHIIYLLIFFKNKLETTIMNKILYTTSTLILFFLGSFSNQVFAQGGTPCPDQAFNAGSVWPNECTIENQVPADFMGQPLEYVWITSTANNGDCGTSISELLPLAVSDLYDDFLASGGFSGGASPVIPGTSWSFVTDDDNDDLSLNIVEVLEPTCYSRCARVVGCSNFFGESAVTVQPCSSILPVELSRFTGDANGCDININWSSSSEENFSHYELERSNDGRTFELAKTVNGSGSLGGGHYFFTDNEAGLENYYRLKMIDHDQSFEYSDVININADCDIIKKIIAYPNPVGDDFINVKVDAKYEAEQVISLVDVTGLEIYKENFQLKEGVNTFQLDVSTLPARIYFIKVGPRTLYRFTKTSQR